MRSWWWRTTASAVRSEGASRTISHPTAGWRSISKRSSAVRIPGLSERPQDIGAQAHRLAQPHGQLGHPRGMALRVGVLGLDRDNERPHGLGVAVLDLVERVPQDDAAEGPLDAPLTTDRAEDRV